jgi:hypothetical protein
VAPACAPDPAFASLASISPKSGKCLASFLFTLGHGASIVLHRRAIVRHLMMNDRHLVMNDRQFL